MAAYIEERTLDLTKTPGRDGQIKPITLRRGEDGATEIRANVKDHGSVFNASGYTVKLKALLPDRNFTIIPGSVLNATSGIVNATVSNSLTAVQGRCLVAYFELTKTGIVLTTDAIPIIVEPDMDMDEGEESEYRNVIDQLMEELEDAIADARQAATDARNAGDDAVDRAEKAAQAATDTAKKAADDLKERADSGEFDGATFTPSVSEDGIWSVTNDKGLPNPEPRNIRGPQGYGMNPPSGRYDNEGELTAEHPSGNPGDSFVVGGDLFVWMEDSDSWENVGQFHGDNAGFGKITAQLLYDDDDMRVEVDTSGPDTAKNIDFKFYNLSGGAAGLVQLDMAINITSTPANGKEYLAGEVVRFDIDFDNTGLVLLRDMFVSVSIGTLPGNDSISLNPGDKGKLSGTYTVTEDDYGTEIVIHATAANDFVTKRAESSVVPVPEPNPHMDVKVTIANTGTGLSNAYTTNDQIKYTVVVSNDGNLTLSDVDISALIGTLSES